MRMLCLGRLLAPAPECKVGANHVPEVVLVAGVVGAVDAETGVEVIQLRWANLEVLGEREVQPAAELHGEGIVVAACRLVARYPQLTDNMLLIMFDFLAVYRAVHISMTCHSARRRLAQVLASSFGGSRQSVKARSPQGSLVKT